MSSFANRDRDEILAAEIARKSAQDLIQAGPITGTTLFHSTGLQFNFLNFVARSLLANYWKQFRARITTCESSQAKRGELDKELLCDDGGDDCDYEAESDLSKEDYL